MDNKPREITIEEWRDISSLPQVRELWGLDETSTPEEFEASAYGAKFDFVSGGPGYFGDLYLIYGDALSGHPVVITRNPKGELEVVQNE